MSYNAYQKTQQSTETAAEIEYRLFTTVTRSLVEVQDKKSHDPDFIKAIDWNRRMWSTFSTDCGAEGNGLPNELRASIVSLAIWVSKHSSAVMRGKESIIDLIEINRTIMEGLNLQIQNFKNNAHQNNLAAQQAQQAATGRSPAVSGTPSPSTPNPTLGNFKPTSI